MSVQIKTVKTRKDLKTFVNLPEKFYRHNPYYVPYLEFDQLDTLDQKKGAAQEFCESELYLAYKDGELVGRVAAIVNKLANKQWDHKEVRFGWIDFTDDQEVSDALMNKVYEFGRARGMEKVVGPLGFTDFDPEGMLVEGYDRLSTMALIYNEPYYVEHMLRMGFEKDADWIEYKVFIPEQMPDRVARVVNIIQQRTNVHLVPLTRKKVDKEGYGKKILAAINECYKKLYNFTVLPEHMADKYLGFYLKVLDLKYVDIVENEKNEIVAFGITMPSIVRALQRCRGHLLPFGWWNLLKSLTWKREDGIELLLVGVLPEYQNSGVQSLIFADLFTKFSRDGIKWAETNAILEDNFKNQGQFKDYDHECKKRRRSFRKKLEY